MGKYRIQNEEGIWLDEKAFTGIFLELLKTDLGPYIDMVGGAGSIIIDGGIDNSLSIEDQFGLEIAVFDPIRNAVSLQEARFNSDVKSLINSDISNTKLHRYSNYFKNTTDGWWGNNSKVSDSTTVLATNPEMDNGLGIYPLMFHYMADEVDGSGVGIDYREDGRAVLADSEYTHFSDDYIGINSDGTNGQFSKAVSALDGSGNNYNISFNNNAFGNNWDRSGTDGSGNSYLGRYNIDANSTYFIRNGTNVRGVHDTQVLLSKDQDTWTRNSFDSLGNALQMRMLMTDTERSGFQRTEDDGVNLLEQDFGFFGTTSGFGQRTSRFYHRDGGNPTDVHELQIQDRLMTLSYGLNGSNTSKLSYTDLGLDLYSQARLRVDNTVSGDAVLEYATDPKLNTGWGARSIPDKAYVDSVSGGGTTVTAKVANYTAVANDFVLMTTGATDKTVTLPAAASNTNAIIEVKKVDSGAGNIIIDGNLAETIDGVTTQTISTQYNSLTLHCDGTTWHIKL